MIEPERDVPPPPSRRKILWTLLATLIVAAVLLVTVVLPAEYQLDPTGAGRLLGLDGLGSGPSQADDIAAADAAITTRRDAPHRTETMTVPLAPREQIEVKIGMVTGHTALFSWKSDGPALYTDFHAEPYNDLNDTNLRYVEEETVTEGHGSIRAPYSGMHGWYWRNDSDQPATITIEVSGYFTELREIFRAPL